MIESDHNNKLAGTYRRLFETLEKNVEQCSTNTLQNLLQGKLSQLKLGLDVFTAASVQSRSKLNTGSSTTVNGKAISFDQKERDLALKISDITNLNELQCLCVWKDFRKENGNYVDQLLKKNASIPLSENVELIMNVTNFYFKDRISLLDCIGYLQRISLDVEHPFNSIANDMVNTLYEDNTNNTPFISRLLAQFSHLIRSQIPTGTHTFSGWATAWAKQNLKEQKSILEVIFLFSITASLPPNFILAVIQEFEVNDFGSVQIFGYALDNEGEKIRKQVTSISCLISASMVIVPNLTMDTKFDTTAVDTSLIDTPEIIAKLNRAVLYMGNSQEHSLFLLAWSYFLACLRNAVKSTPNLPKRYDEVKLVLEGKQNLSPSDLSGKLFTQGTGSEIFEKRTPCIQQNDHLERTLTGRVLKLGVFDMINEMFGCGMCDEDDMNSYYYRSVLRTILKSFLATTLPQFLPMESYSSLIECYCATYREQPDLCQAFWKDDVNEENEYPLMTTALGRFPVFFTHFTELLSSLSSTSDLDFRSEGKPVDKVFEYLCAIPTITVVLKNNICLTASVENNVASIHTNQVIYVTPMLDYVTGIMIPEHTRGILLSNTEENHVVHFSHTYSGWHMLVSILANFMKQYRTNSIDVQDEDYTLHGGRQEAITSILKLVHSVLINSPRLAPDLVNHVQAIASIPGVSYNTPILVSVLCDVLSFCCKLQPCPVPVATLTVKCLTVLLPHHRQYIWNYLQTSPILPRIFSNASTGFSGSQFTTSIGLQIQQIVSKFECTTGSYDLLLSFLDLVHALVRDIQYNWWVEETDMNGPVSNNEMQLQTLYTCLHYLILEVFPSFPSWRYKNLSDRYNIGIKLLSIFIEICNYFKEPSCSTKTKPTLSSIRDDIFDSFLYKCGPYHISPLFDITSDGANIATSLYESGHIKEAHKAEELTALTLVFIKILLQQRLEHVDEGTSKPESTFERLMFDYNTNHNSSDILLRIAKHINYRYNTTLPIQATQVLSLLCRTTFSWKTAPSFVQYLGDTAETHSVIRTYLETVKEATQSEVLLSSIWRLITSLLETQPSLAILFLDCGDFILPSSKATVRSQGAPESAIRVALDMLEKWEILSMEKPTVASNILQFLSVFWKTALDHYALVERTRNDGVLWNAIGRVLLTPFMETDACESSLENINLLETNFSEQDRYDSGVRQLCCANLNKAFAMRIIAYEIHLTAGNQKKRDFASKDANALPVGLKSLLSKISEPTKLAQLRTNSTKIDFNPNLTKLAHGSATTLLQTVGISDSSFLLFKGRSIGSGVDDALGEVRQYGDSYLFNIRMAVSRIFALYGDFKEKHGLVEEEDILATSEVNTALDIELYSNNFLKSVLKANHNYSVVDSQARLLRSFKVFIETCSHHVNSLIWVTKDSVSGPENLRNFICDLIEQTERENRQDGVALTSYGVLIRIIRNLVEEFIDVSKPILVGQDAVAKKKYTSHITHILTSLCRLLERENYALIQSVSDIAPVYFHRPLLESVLLCIYTIRGTINYVDKGSAVSAKMQTCLQTIMSVVCSSFQVLTIKAQSFSAEDSFAAEEDIDNCVKDITVATSLLQEIIGSRYGIEENIWLAEFTKHHTFESLLKLYFWGVELMLNEIDRQTTCSDRLNSLNITPYTEIALYFLLTLSNIPNAAEQLINCHFFDHLTNNSLTTHLQQGSLDLFIRFGDKSKNEPSYVERNPLHFAWCQTLGVISNLLRTVGSSQLVLNNVVNVLQICGPQIGKAFEKANTRIDSLFALVPLESLSTPLLEELECINAVFYGLSKHLSHIPNIATSLLTSYKDSSLLLLQRYLYFFTHPSHMKAHLYRTDSTETIEQFMQKTLKSILTITHCMMTTLTILSSADIVLTAPDVEWPFGNAIIYPDMRASTDATASFGTLVECINAGIAMVNQYQDLQDKPLQQALNVIQSCSLMLTSQAALWIAKPDITDEMRMRIVTDNIMDIAEALSKVASTLEKLAEKKIVADIRSRTKLIYMLQTFVNNRYFES
ncbi:unnamed protein product [Rhizopus stolonifer]